MASQSKPSGRGEREADPRENGCLWAEEPGLTWCDLGSPGRVLKTLAGFRIAVPWQAAAMA